MCANNTRPSPGQDRDAEQLGPAGAVVELTSTAAAEDKRAMLVKLFALVIPLLETCPTQALVEVRKDSDEVAQLLQPGLWSQAAGISAQLCMSSLTLAKVLSPLF